MPAVAGDQNRPESPRSDASRQPASRQPYTRAQRLTLLACILGSSAAFLDGTIVNVALPAIRANLHGGLGTQEWVVDGYLLTLGSLLLVGGSLGDAFGRRKIFTLGVAGFGVASLVCAVAPDAGALIAARAIQGIAAALLVPSTLALIIDTFSEHQRAAAIGAWTAWTGIATVAGPLLGGLLVQAGSWRWVFVVNVPLVLFTLWLVRHIPARPAVGDPHVDWVGGLLGALGLAGPIYALIEQPNYGWGDPRVLATLGAGCVLLIAFGLWERGCRAPMLPVEIFRSRNFSVGNLATFALYAALSVASFFLIVFLQQVGGYRPLTAGLSLLPLSILMFLLARRFGALADRFGPRLFMGIGPIVAAVGLLLLAAMGTHPQYRTEVLPGVVLLGIGLSITVAPLTAAILNAAPATHSGVASGINNAVARIAGLIAIAVVGAVVASGFSSQVDQRLARRYAPAAYRVAVARAASTTLQTRVPAGFTSAQRTHVHRTLEHASLDAFRLAMLIAAALALASGLLSLLGIATKEPA
ncbi:MAG TPA: MFS transporter [Solirubrobacteraceae bacterium]|nr:MFS transporter [Solirubrobacteraceae bacterium]